jgi:hypothetical protein
MFLTGGALSATLKVAAGEKPARPARNLAAKRSIVDLLRPGDRPQAQSPETGL